MLAASLTALALGDAFILMVVVGVVCGANHGVLMPGLCALPLFGIPRDRRGWSVALLAAAFDLGNVLGARDLAW